MSYLGVLKALNHAKIRYVVVGGMAVNLHGYQRFTKDLDLMIALDPENLNHFFDVLKKIGYVPKVPVTKEQFVDAKQRAKWKKEKGMIVFSFVETKPPFNLIDMFVDEPILFSEVYRQKVYGHIAGVRVPILSVNHLIKLKLKASRSRDLDDIAQLREIQEKQGL